MSHTCKKNISVMFDEISCTYDRVNRWMTFGQDRRWRKSMQTFLPKKDHLQLLDLATGTGDQILALIDSVDMAVGIDLAEEMLAIGRKKCERFGSKVRLEKASALDVPYEDGTFDVCTISFGIRNVVSVEKCLKEMRRVLCSGGRALILETGLSDHRFLRFGQLFYLRYILPTLGKILSGQGSAYKYLNTTIETFPYGSQFIGIMKKCGFSRVETRSFMFGNVRLYVGYL